MRKFRMPSHGTVVAYTALFVTLGGTAVALESASVTQREIATGGVGSSEIKTGAVKRSEIRTGGVGSAEIRTSGVRSLEIAHQAVDTDELDDLAVTEPKLFDGAVTEQKIAAGAVNGDHVTDGSLKLADVAQGIATVTYDPPVMGAGDCSAENSIAVPNKQAGDTVLVLPGPAGGTDGWNEQFTLDAYGTSASGAGNTISVVVCRNFGAGPADAGPLPLRVLLFR